MCGIAGLLLPPGGEVDEGLVGDVSERLRHRGPDGLGFLGWSEQAGVASARDPRAVRGRRLAFIHRRLSILDLSDGGAQPMSSADGRLHLVFNGEIYNYRELRVELAALGHRFRSASDTEVLLAAIGEWGSAALPRLVGMFALALLDLRERRLLLARDFFGIKPLYYTASSRGFAFASEIKSLLRLAGSGARINPQRLYDYLRFGLTDHGGETMLDGVRQLLPGHLLALPLAGPERWREESYFGIDTARRSDLGFEDAAARVRDLFLESVKLHLRSDVPVGAALSGGVDSSAIVMAMRHLEGDKLDLRTITYTAGAREIDESAFAEQVRSAAGAEMTLVKPSPDDLVEDLEHLIGVQEEPFGSTSIYAQYRVFRAAREAGVKVMLDGQGADEILGGYRPYLAARLTSLLRQGRIGAALTFARQAARLPGGSGKALLLGLARDLTPPALENRLRRLAGKAPFPPWLDEAWFRERGVSPGSPFPRSTGREAMKGQMHATLFKTSLPMLLRYEDRNSMAFSIESRVPFLTPALVQFLFSLPEEYLVAADGTTKAVFRQAMRGIVPDAILDRRDKIGFATPERDWLLGRRAWVDAVLASAAAGSIPALRIEAARADWEGIVAGRRRYDWRVWRWINLVRWSERFAVSYASSGKEEQA